VGRSRRACGARKIKNAVVKCECRVAPVLSVKPARAVWLISYPFSVSEPPALLGVVLWCCQTD
jgi:hypothetical protein